jgi:hypothetical protein
MFLLILLSIKETSYRNLVVDGIVCSCPSTLSQEHRLRVFENRVLRRVFGSKRDEVTGG